MPRFPALLVALVALAPFFAGDAWARKPSRDVEALYKTLEESSAGYRAGLDQLQKGEKDAGRKAIRESAARLLEAGNRCGSVRGCEVGRFLAAYDSLIAKRASLLDGEGEGFGAEGSDGSATGEGSAVLANVREAGRPVAMLRGQDLRQMIEMNEPVRAALAEWLTWMRPSLITSWENYQRMRFLMWPEYERAGLPEALLFGILAKESNGRVHAVSKAGAAGPMQFMPATGQRFGLGWQDGFDTRYDPQLAARASVLYFNERFAELGDNLEFAVAAYNGGEGRALRLKQAAGDRNFWDPRVWGQLPPETRDYVPYVIAAAWLFLHPEDYGLQFPKVDGAATVLKLEMPASIYQLAICLGGERDGYFRTLRNLNPRYEPHVAIAAGSELRVPVAVPPLYRQHCLQGSRAVLAQQLVTAQKPVFAATAKAPAATSSAAGSYKVRNGDTLSGIARRFRCDGADQLAKSNRLRSPYTIRPGQRLNLRGCDG